MINNKKLLPILVFVSVAGFVAVVFFANNRSSTSTNSIMMEDKVDTNGMAKNIPISDTTDPINELDSINVPISDTTDPDQVINELDSIFVKVDVTPGINDLNQ